MNKAVFLDRDGVINYNNEYYVKNEKEFRLLPKVIDALKLLKKNGYLLIIVTNQGGISKGAYTEEDLKRIHKKMFNIFKKNKVEIDALYYCPHHDKDKCNCRKPNTKLFKIAKKKFNISFRKSFLVGDKTSDIKAGKNIRCKTILVKTGWGGRDKRFRVKPHFIVKNLYEAAKLISKLEKVYK